MMVENKRLFGKSEITRHHFKKSLVKIFGEAQAGFEVKKSLLPALSKLSNPTVTRYLQHEEVLKVLKDLNVQIVGRKLIKVEE